MTIFTPGASSGSTPPNPKRVAAGRANGAKRRPWSAEDRVRQRQICLGTQPWQRSTGPRSAEGKRRAAANGLRNQRRSGSSRQGRGAVADVASMIRMMTDLRAGLGLEFGPRLGVILEDTMLTDNGIEHLIDLKGLTNVYLNGPQVTPAGRAALKKALRRHSRPAPAHPPVRRVRE